MSEGKKIQGSDLIAPGYLTKAIEEAEKFLHVITQTKKIIIETNKATGGKLKDASKGSASKDLKDANNLMNESIKQRKLIVAATLAEEKATLDLAKSKKALADFEKKKLMDDEKAVKIIEKQNSAYAKASDRLNQLRKTYKDLAISGKGAEVATHNMLMEIQKLDKQLKEVDASVGQFNRSVGDYKNQMSEAITESEAFSAGLNKMDASSQAAIAGLSGIINQLKELRKGQQAAITMSGKLGNALKIGGIAILLAALASIAAFFSASREGALEFDLMLNKIKATIDILIGSFAQLGKGLILQFKSWGAYLTGLKEDLKSPFKESAKAQEAYRESAKLSTEATKLMSTAFDGNTAAIDAQAKEYDKLTRAMFAYEDQLRILQVQQAKFNMDEEDFNEIAADNTISLNKQKAALEGGIQARLNSAKVGRIIAEKEFELAKMQVELELRKNKVSEADIALAKKKGLEHLTEGKLSIKVSTEALNAVQEKYLAELKAADVLDDLDRQEAERKRQILQTETINSIELIRSKKLGADAAVQILTKQVADEKNQLEERENFQAQLSQKQKEALDEEIKLLGNFGLTQSEVLDLINEKDAVRLANRIKELRNTRLSEEAETELAKVILEAQNAQLARDAQQAKFDEERIKRNEKIIQLTREISIIQEQSVLDDVANIEQQRIKILDEANNTILQNDNVFNRNLINQRREASILEESILEEKFKIQKDLLAKQYEIDRENINKSVDDNEIKNKEIEKLDAVYLQNQNKLALEISKTKEDFTKKELAQLQAIENRKTEVVIDALVKTTQALTNELDKRQQVQNNIAQNELSRTEANIQKQADLASRGLANTLAYQEEQLAKQQLAQQDALKKQAKQKEELALVEALFNAYNSELKQPNANPGTAAAKALADVLLFKGLAAGVVQFAADGNDRVQGPGTTTSDSIPFMLSKDEGVVKADANMNNPGVVAALNAGMFDKMYMPKIDANTIDSSSTAKNISDSFALQNNKEIIHLLREIKNKPSQNLDIDKFGNIIEKIYKDGLVSITTYKSRRPRI